MPNRFTPAVGHRGNCEYYAILKDTLLKRDYTAPTTTFDEERALAYAKLAADLSEWFNHPMWPSLPPKEDTIFVTVRGGVADCDNPRVAIIDYDDIKAGGWNTLDAEQKEFVHGDDPALAAELEASTKEEA